MRKELALTFLASTFKICFLAQVHINTIFSHILMFLSIIPDINIYLPKSCVTCGARARHVIAQNLFWGENGYVQKLCRVLVWPLNCLLRRSIMMTPASEQI